MSARKNSKAPRAGLGIWTWLDDVRREVRQAARVLARAPGHTVAIIALLAMGIGANAAMFSLIDAIYLRDLPVPHPEQLVALEPGWANPQFEEFRRAQHSFSGILATGSMMGTVIAPHNGGQLNGLTGAFVTGNYFQVLGVQAALGRVFTEEDDRDRDPHQVVVISDSFWRRQFGADPNLPGLPISLAGNRFTIIGVTPREFVGDMPGRTRDVWAPMNTQPMANPQGDVRQNRGFHWLSVMGRLKPGVSRGQALAEGTAIYGRINPVRRGQRALDSTLRMDAASAGFGGYRRQYETPVRILVGIAAIVLVIVWANVAALLLARGAARRQEMAIRQALGCGRARLLRQCLLEGLLLAAAGGSIGLAIAPAAARGLLLMQPVYSAPKLDLKLDGAMLLFGLGISLVTAVAFSLTPALRASQGGIEGALKSASRGSTERRQLTIRCVIGLQAALSVVLVSGAALFAGSLIRLQQIEIGFAPAHVVTVTIDPRFAGYRDDESQARLSQRLLERVSALPRVQSATAGLCAVLMGCSRREVVKMDGREAQADDPGVWINPVYPNYFETLGMPIVKGRNFGPGDRPGSARTAVVTEALARYYFPGENPLGKRITERTSPEPIEIIGVVRDVKFVSPRDPAIRMVFLSRAQIPGPVAYIQVRVAGAPEAMIGPIRQALLQVEPKLFMLGPDTLEAGRAGNLSRERLLAQASALFGGIALVLACFGVYGVISYLVAARTQELGIRLAIGAQPGDVQRNVIGDALQTMTPGIALGLACAYGAGRWIESLLYRVTARDPLTYLAVAAVLVGVTIAAALIPAVRASRIDPLVALRCEG